MSIPRSRLSVLLTALSLALACTGCGDGGEAPAAAPTFCPTALASRLQATPGVNSPPSAYYQSLSSRAETTLRVTLLACDPDHPSTSAGLAWSVIPDPASSPAGIPGPSHGTLSATAGTYPDAVISYTPAPGFSGSDAFWYHVVDAHGATGNAAGIFISVLPVPVSLLVSGPSSAVEDTTITFTATASWIGTSPSDVTPRARWTEDSPYASFLSPGVLTIGPVPSDQTVTVTAAFSANGASVSDTLALTVLNVNRPPVANAASYATSEDIPLQIQLVASDPDGDPLLYDIVANGSIGAAYLDSPSGGVVDYLPNAGVFGTDRFVFQAFDGADWSNSAAVTVTIHPVNDLPAPSIAGTGSANEGEVVSFTGTINDPDGPSPFSYTFAFGDGGALSGTTSSNAVAGTHLYLRDRYSPPYTVTLTVSDALGAGASASRTIQILNVAPSVTIAGPASAQTGSPVQFSAIVSDPADTVFTYRWDFEDDGTFDSVLPSPTHAFMAASVYTVRLQVGDGTGWGTDTLTVTVTGSPVNAPPAVSIDSAPASLNEGQEGFFTGSYTDTDGPTPHATYWDWGDGTATENALTPGHRFPDGPADYTVLLRVTDGLGAAGTDSVVVNVLNASPLPVAVADTQHTSVGTTVNFDGSGSSDPGNDVLSYRWIFGDGNSTSYSPSPLASHVYVADGIYTVILRVRDEDGGLSDGMLNVNVGGIPLPTTLFLFHDNGILAFDQVSGTFSSFTGAVGFSRLYGLGGHVAFFDEGGLGYGLIFFSGMNATGTSMDLWSVDPLTGSSYRVSDVSNIYGGMNPADLTVLDRQLLMSGYDGGNSRQLWGGSGPGNLYTITDRGTRMRPSYITPYRGKAFFGGYDLGTESDQLRSFDGVNGPAVCASTSSGLRPEDLTVFGGRLCFGGQHPTVSAGYELWCYDPADGLVQVTETGGTFYPRDFEVLDGVLYFRAQDAQTQFQLFAWDGIDAPTQVSTASTGLDPQELRVLDGRLYFYGRDWVNGGSALWSFEPGIGLTNHTNWPQMTALSPLTVHNGRLYLQIQDLYGTHFCDFKHGDGLYVRSVTGWTMREALGLGTGFLPFFDLSGTWTFEETVTADSCGGTVGSVFTYPVGILQRGADVVINGPSVTYNAFMSGAYLEGRPRTYPENGGFTTMAFYGGVDTPGETLAGIGNWSWMDSTTSCNGSSAFLGRKDVAGAWDPPTFGPWPVSSLSISQPDLAVDGTGKGMVVWSDSPDGGYVNAMAIPARSGTLAPVSVEDNWALNPYPAAFDLARDGSGLAVWQGSSFIGSAAPVRYALFDGNAWGPANTLSIPAKASSAEGPFLDVTPGGNGIALWKGGESGQTLRLGWFDSLSGTWDTNLLSVPIAGLPMNVYPAVAAFGESTGYGLYAIGNWVFLIYDHPTSGWISQEIFVGGADVTGIAAGSGGGVAAAAWSEAGGDVYCLTSPGLNTTISVINGVGTGRNPQVAVDGTGTITVAWDDGAGNVQARTKPAGSTWEPPVAVNTPGVWAERPALSVDPYGRTAIAWVQGRDNSTSQLFDVYASSRLPGRPWRAPVGIQTDVDQPVLFPVRIGQTADGRAMASWLSYDPAAPTPKGRLWVSRRR